MPGREYVCGECGHRFGTPDDMPRNTRALMCPSCGSVDLTIVDGQRPRPVVMRANEPAQVVDGARRRDAESN